MEVKFVPKLFEESIGCLVMISFLIKEKEVYFSPHVLQ